MKTNREIRVRSRRSCRLQGRNAWWIPSRFARGLRFGEALLEFGSSGRIFGSLCILRFIGHRKPIGAQVKGAGYSSLLEEALKFVSGNTDAIPSHDDCSELSPLNERPHVRPAYAKRSCDLLLLKILSQPILFVSRESAHVVNA